MYGGMLLSGSANPMLSDSLEGVRGREVGGEKEAQEGATIRIPMLLYGRN